MTTWLGAVMKNYDVPHNASGVIRVPCKLCQTYISGTSTSAGNFMKHLKRKHVDIYLSLISVKYKFDPTVKSTKPNTSKNSSSQDDSEQSTESSPKKYMNYSQEFKLKILEYYFKNGGENKFGLKSKTAQLFRVDKKTINRMLCNPEMVRKACKAINQKPPSVFATLKHPNDTGPSSHSSNQHGSCSQNSVVIDLPEDPDFSVLKQAISSPASGIGSVTRVLLTGTKEVQRIILEECDIIYECKVCRNLFRSLINFLAHKRMYCEEHFVNVQNIFHKDNCGGRTTESNTVIVEPEPPDDLDENDGPKIDRIAAKLASKTTQSSKRINQLSSSVNKGSSMYYDMIDRTQENRNQFKKDCSIILKNVSIANKAVYQDYVSHGEQPPAEGTKELARQAMENRMGVTAVLGEDGKIIGTQVGAPVEIDMDNVQEVKNNNSYFDPSPVDSPCDSPSIEENETDESDAYERTIYTCPICSTQFLSMGGCNKHLLRVHRKKKHQRERLRQVISSRTYKKTFSKEALKNYHLKNEENKEKDSVISSVTQGEAKDKKSPDGKIRTVSGASQSREEIAPKLQNLCIRCKKTFLTAGALGSHIKYCQYQPINPKPMNEHPEKKIAIQIRKDYNKKEYVVSNISNCIPTVLPNRPKIELTNVSTDQKRVMEVIEAKSKILTEPGKLNCIPCKKKFPKRSSLQYHIAKHLNYTRFKCINCDFRTYHRYTIARHCESSHLISNCFHDDDKLGIFMYDLDEFKRFHNIIANIPNDEPDDDYKKLLNSIDDLKTESSDANEVKLEESNGDEVLITNDIDPLAIGSPANDDADILDVDENADSALKAERPQRNRRSVERKDFIYEIKLPQPAKSIEEEGIKLESNKRRGSPVEELIRKKIPKVDDNLCNGKSSPLLQIINEPIQDDEATNNALEKTPDPSLSPGPSKE